MSLRPSEHPWLDAFVNAAHHRLRLRTLSLQRSGFINHKQALSSKEA